MAWPIGALHFDYSIDPIGLFGLYFAVHSASILNGLDDYLRDYS